MLMDYPNGLRLKINALAEFRELKDDADLARRLASLQRKVEHAVPLRLELPAAHHAVLPRARVGASARSGQVPHLRPGRRDEGVQSRQFQPGQRGEQPSTRSGTVTLVRRSVLSR